MSTWEPVALTRACPATTVPYGQHVTLDQGGLVQVVQRFGRSITIRTEMGALMQIDGADADAVGLDPIVIAHGPADGPFDINKVITALQAVYDPEIPVSIVELGLVYRCEEVMAPDGTRRIEVDMSMTAPGCGMGDILRSQAMQAIEVVPGVDDVAVSLVWDPPWNISRMSDAARLELGLL